VEALFYALFPVLIRGLLRLTPSQRRWLLIALIAARMAVMVLGRGSLTFFPPARLPEFVIGILLALVLKDGWVPRIPLPAAALLAAGTYVLVGWAQPVALLTIIAIAILIVAAAQTDLADRPSLLRHRVLVRLGVWSFAFYLCHRFVITLSPALDRVGSAEPGQAAVAILLLGISLIAAATLHRVVERPAQRWLLPGVAGSSISQVGFRKRAK
jgi:peptidoglycan/LPS O-acetylase OafA/YrhL